MNTKRLPIFILFVVCLTSLACSNGKEAENSSSTDEVFTSQTPTQFEVAPFWPAQLPNGWTLGDVAGVAVDANDHIWIVQRPNTLTDREKMAATDPPSSICCKPAPSVMEFDPDGKLIQAWGNPDTSQRWITNEHGIYIDAEENVWIGGSGANDQVVLKFSKDGKLLLQIGEWGVTKGSNDPTHLGGPADIAVDVEANEVFIADGYGNRRVIVFDATTGVYKRHWGAYGEVPHDDELPAYTPGEEPLKSFRNPVHAIRISRDGLVYVADRVGNRIQVFQKDGTFVQEGILATQTLGIGAAWDIELSPDENETYLYIADGMNRKVWVMERSSMEVVNSFGSGGRNAGQFGWIHNLAMDSKGNIYTSEVTPGQRVQKFRPVGEGK